MSRPQQVEAAQEHAEDEQEHHRPPDGGAQPGRSALAPVPALALTARFAPLAPVPCVSRVPGVPGVPGVPLIPLVPLVSLRAARPLERRQALVLLAHHRITPETRRKMVVRAAPQQAEMIPRTAALQAR